MQLIFDNQIFSIMFVFGIIQRYFFIKKKNCVRFYFRRLIDKTISLGMMSHVVTIPNPSFSQQNTGKQESKSPPFPITTHVLPFSISDVTLSRPVQENVNNFIYCKVSEICLDYL